MNKLLEQLSNFGVGRLAVIFGLTAGVALALALFVMSMNSSSQALLFSGLEPRDAQTVTERLDQAGIAYELREGGSAVYVSTDDVDTARMRVAADGELGFGSVGYEIFDETDALGTTSFVQNVNAKRALEGELARSINTLASVSGARVHLVLPERRLFSRDAMDPSASVVINTRGELSQSQVATIRNLIATAVPDLAANRITVADQTGRLLASPSGEEGASAQLLEERRGDVEAGMRAKILDVVEGVVGPGRARVVVTAQLSRESMTENSQRFDPDGRVLRSEESTQERTRDVDGRDGAVSASENLPDEEAEPGEPTTTSSSDRESEIRNFEISTTNTTRVREAGAVERLSVAVAVDGVTALGEDGTAQWEPRPEAELQEIRSLVAAAMGYDEERGDALEVRNLRFDRPDLMAGTPAPEGFSLSQLDLMRIAEIAILFVTALLIVLLVARPLVKGVLSPPQPALAGAAPGAGTAAIASNGEPGVALPEPEEPEETIDIAQIDGQVKKSSVRKVSNLVKDHPEESLSILRNWMHEG